MSLEINGELIDDELIEEEFQHYIHQYQESGETVDGEELLNWVKEEIVLKTILRQEVAKEKYSLSETQLAREVSSFVSWNEVAAKLATQSQDDLKDYVLYKLKEAQLVERVTEDMDAPQASHLETFYRDNSEDYLTTRYDWVEVVVEMGAERESGALDEKLASLKNHKELTDFLNSFVGQIVRKNYSGFAPQLSEEGGVILNHLANHLVSKIYTSPVVLFRDSEKSGVVGSKEMEEDKNIVYFYYLQKENSNYLPSLTEIESLVRDDLLAEMRRLKLNLYLRKKMQKSKITDNQYLG